MRTISKLQARQFLLAKQGLIGKHRFIGKQGALEYVRQAGCIQFDPVDVCGKNAELTLQSRVKGFTKKQLYTLLYKDRALIDYSDKELSIWPVEDWPYFSSYRERSRTLGQSFAQIPELSAQAIAYIRRRGPVSSDTLPIDGKLFWHSSMHWSGNWHGQSPAARSVLEQLYADGVLVIHHKNGSRKFYDLAETQLPKALLTAPNPCADAQSFLHWRILRRVGAVGLLWDRRSDAFLGIEMTTQQRSEAFEALAKTEKLLCVQVEGMRFLLYLLPDDLPLLEAVLNDAVDFAPRLEFLAPLDPFLWDRKLIEALWGYHYSWEIYTPPEKRKYGHYVLPMLYGEDFIGRIEAIADAKAGVLTVKNIWYEDGVRKTKKMAAALARSVQRLAKFNGCSEVVYL